MRRVYELLLRLYPAAYRELFGEEMPRVFEQAAAERRGMALARFAAGEWMGLAAGAAAAWIDRWKTDPALDLTKMRPVDVTRESYVSALDEVIEAQKAVDFHLRRMQAAISRHDFVEARLSSDQDRRARENLRLVRRKYHIAE
ncbi:MAG: hypothetical protein LAP40_17055 [Acidobacteriia bacterium]|nr:hypothetical protein [Terriglobia bacterium]